MTTRYVLAVAAILILLAIALAAVLGDRGGVAHPSPTPTSSPTATPTGEATAAAATSAPPTTSSSPTTAPAGMGKISGEVGFPSESRPELEVYAIDVRDRSRWYSVTTPAYAGQGTGGTASPSPDPGKVYSIQVPPGTYHVVAYLKDSPQGTGPGLYSQYVLCGLRASCSDHTLIEVTVAAGETRNDIDPVDWYYQPGQATYPPRPTPR